ncbi:hypothetical protein HJC23_007617 [Cyclotella cryptica]|uniref:Uncharacterized protein n=1 Tax=Cyclotella cryptica TaxID=29204 RepID=A0ABD3QR35_9STRA|eukprot:CCRYP_002903-RA/>CCRYP_002903-RA protein AED:0.37 eAED:0.37 QI:0/-1/0/1/-1/1/1/0/266
MDETQESAIADFLKILEEHRKNCEQRGKYVEAEVAKRRFEELKSHEVNRRLESMKAHQLKERLGLEEAHMLEFQQFNSLWNKKSRDYEDQCENQITKMKDRHLEELKEFQQKLLEKQQKPKFSAVLLNYRKIEERLARSKNYGEAHKVKAKADQTEAIEIEQWNAKKQKEMFQQESIFKAAKRQELRALQKRIKTGRESHNKQRQLALERLIQRYQNVKNELEASHNLERINAEKNGLQGNKTSLSVADRKSNRRTVATLCTTSNC